MKYKIGDKVTLTNGDIMTVDQINDKFKWYLMREDPLNCYTDEMIEGLVEAETKPKLGTALNPIEPKSNANCLTRERAEGLAIKIDKEIPSGNQNVWELPEGYQFTDENGNVINATKIVLEKKKKEYPKTYEECCEILFGDKSYSEFRFVPAKISNVCTSYVKGDIVTDLPSKIIPYEEQINILYKLLICRTAYWKIAGEEMGLGKPWEPGDNKVFGIIRQIGKIQKYHDFVGGSTTLEFPTEEMRDAFYENFKSEIESCKELL